MLDSGEGNQTIVKIWWIVVVVGLATYLVFE